MQLFYHSPVDFVSELISVGTKALDIGREKDVLSTVEAKMTPSEQFSVAHVWMQRREKPGWAGVIRNVTGERADGRRKDDSGQDSSSNCSQY